MSIGLTTLAVLVPLAAAVVVGVLPRSEPGLVRRIGRIGALLELIVIGLLLLRFDPEGPPVQQLDVHAWLPGLGVAWSLGLEGSSLAPLALVGLIFPLALLIGPPPRPGEPPLVVGMLVLQAAYVGFLLARDLIVLAACWELAIVISIVLVGERGDGKQGVAGRTSAARRYALHVLPGALSLLAAIVLLGVAHSHATGGAWAWDMDALAEVVMPAPLQQLGFVLVLITLAAALPLFPLQSWLGPLGATGPTPVIAVLAGVGMPMAVVLLQRVALPSFPLAAGEWADPLAAIAVVGAAYAALACWAEREPGRLLGHAALLHVALAVIAALSGSAGARASLGLYLLAHGLGLTMLATVFGWLRRQQVGNLGELAGWAAVAPRALAMAMAAVLVLVGLPGTVGFVAELGVVAGVIGDDGSLELLRPRVWASLAVILTSLGGLGILRSLWHAGRGKPRPGLAPRLAAFEAREQAVGVLALSLALVGGFASGPLLARILPAEQRAVDELHRARCLAIEGSQQPRPRLRDEFVSLCLDPAARIRQVYGLPGGEGHRHHDEEVAP